MPYSLSLRRRRNQLMQRVVLHVFLTTAWVLLVATQYWSALNDREAARHAAQTNALNLASSLAQHAGDTFQLADTVLSGLVSRLEDGPHADPEALHRFLVSEAARSERIHGLFVYDADGNWVSSSLATTPRVLNNRDREYFRYHSANKDRIAHIGPPLQSRSDGSWIVTISRRLDRPDGGFAGVVLASIQLRYFENYYSSFDVGHNGTIGMTGSDGTVLVRLPYDQSAHSRSIAGTSIFQTMHRQRRGALAYRSPIDGTARIAGFAPANGFPLEILAGVSEEEAMAPWRKSVRHRIAITVLGVALLLGAGIWLDIQLRRTHQSERRLSEQASVDGLTGLFNRRTLDRRLEQAIRETERGHDHLTLMLVDVDHFKLYNDTYGHANGDACLRKVAEALTFNTRDSDLVARYGGEEFALVLRGCDAIHAAQRAQQLVDRVRDLRLAHAASKTSDVVTISIGVATCGPGCRFSTTELAVLADRALYTAKDNGRDRFVQAPQNA